MKNANWAYAQGVDSTSDKLKWSLLYYSQYSIQISTTAIFKNIQPEMKLVAKQPTHEATLTKLLVRLLMAKDIIPRSIQFYSQIGPNCERFNNFKISDKAEVDNVSLAVTDNFFEHVRDENPRPRADALVKMKKYCNGERHIGSICTGMGIGTYAQCMGFKDFSGNQIKTENKKVLNAGENDKSSLLKNGNSQTKDKMDDANQESIAKKTHPNKEENQKVLDAGGKSSNSVHGQCAGIAPTTDIALSIEISSEQTKEAPSAASRQEKKKSSAAVAFPHDVPPQLGSLINELTKKRSR